MCVGLCLFLLLLFFSAVRRSRSIGDEVSQTVGVTSVPEISKHLLVGEDVFAVWASDGVWEFIDDAEAIKIVNKHYPDLDAAALALADASTKRWRAEEEVIDDITVVIVAFNKPSPAAA